MAAKTQTLKFKRTVNAPAAEAYRAFTKASALQDWFCNAAQADPRKGGRLYLWWDSGYFVNGEFTALEPGKKIALDWHGRGEPEATRVLITFRAKDQGTLVGVSHSGVGTGAKWKQAIAEFQRGWEAGLENLQSVLETGIDLRLARRPMLGIIPTELGGPEAARLGLKIPGGIKLEGVIDGMGAVAAGLTRGDVIVAMAGKKVTDFASLVSALAGRHGGDSVPVSFYRGKEKKTVPMELSRRPMPETPGSPQDLAAVARAGYAEVSAELAKYARDLTETQAGIRPAPDEWSFKEILAHFIATERDLHSWMAEMINDGRPGDSLEYRPNVMARVGATVAVLPTLPALLEELRQMQAETVEMLSTLPPELVCRKHLYFRIALWIGQITRGHLYDEHKAQIEATIRNAVVSSQ